MPSPNAKVAKYIEENHLGGWFLKEKKDQHIYVIKSGTVTTVNGSFKPKCVHIKIVFNEKDDGVIRSLENRHNEQMNAFTKARPVSFEFTFFKNKSWLKNKAFRNRETVTLSPQEVMNPHLKVNSEGTGLKFTSGPDKKFEMHIMEFQGKRNDKQYFDLFVQKIRNVRQWVMAEQILALKNDEYNDAEKRKPIRNPFGGGMVRFGGDRTRIPTPEDFEEKTDNVSQKSDVPDDPFGAPPARKLGTVIPMGAAFKKPSNKSMLPPKRDQDEPKQEPLVGDSPAPKKELPAPKKKLPDIEEMMARALFNNPNRVNEEKDARRRLCTTASDETEVMTAFMALLPLLLLLAFMFRRFYAPVETSFDKKHDKDSESDDFSMV